MHLKLCTVCRNGCYESMNVETTNERRLSTQIINQSNTPSKPSSSQF